MMNITFESGAPIYKQLVTHIMGLVRNGDLPPGRKLPTERELAEQLKISRGTVKKAFSILADNNIISIIHGSGSYVYKPAEEYSVEHRRHALKLIDTTIEQLIDMNLSHDEISAMLSLSLNKRTGHPSDVRIAAIDCNPESLLIFKKQLGYIPGVSITTIMLDTIIMSDEPHRMLYSFDLVVTTVTHFEQVQDAISGLDIELIPAEINPDRRTVIDISTISQEHSAAILCQSSKYAYLINEYYTSFHPSAEPLPMFFERDAHSSAKLLGSYDALITSPDLLLFAEKPKEVEQFRTMGGIIIPFEYNIDKATLIRLEQRTDDILNKRRPRI